MEKAFSSSVAQTLSPEKLTSQLQEALVMASMASLRNDLAVQLGDWWSFNWKTNVISLPKIELERCPQEEICWIILHEAAHAALTRLQDILPMETLQRPEVEFLLQCTEDVRIENWLTQRFPGSQPWKQVCDTLNSVHDPSTPEEVEQENPARAFLRGLMRLGSTGGLPATIHPVALAALEEARPSLEAAFACVPPSASVDPASVEPVYRHHPVSRCYAGTDRKHAPSAMEQWVRIMQAAFWSHVATGVLPVFMRLIKQYGCPETPFRRTIRVTRGGAPQGPARSSEELEEALRAELKNGGSGRYLQTVAKYAPQIRAITDLLERLLPNHRSLQHVRGRRTGDRLDLRVAVQFEADRRLHEKLWMRRQKPTLPEPAFVFMLDCSESMRQGGKSQAAFESLVIIREACTRAGIPFSVMMFNTQAETIHGWDQMNDSASEAALSLILRPLGGTSIAEALKCAERELKQRQERDRYLFLMSDGASPAEDRKSAIKRLARLSEAHINVVPFGIGEEGEEIKMIFPDAEVVRKAFDFPDALAKTLIRVLTPMAI